MELFLFCWLGFAALVGFIAGDRGRNGWVFFFLSLILSPLLILLVVLVIPNLKVEEAKAQAERRDRENREFDQQREHERQLEALRALKSEPVQSASKADELVKLAALLKDGVLTQDEFDAQKRRVLQP